MLDYYLRIKESKTNTAHKFDGMRPAQIRIIVNPAQNSLPHNLLALHIQLVLQNDGIQFIQRQVQELITLWRNGHEVTKQVSSRVCLQFIAKDAPGIFKSFRKLLYPLPNFSSFSIGYLCR